MFACKPHSAVLIYHSNQLRAVQDPLLRICVCYLFLPITVVPMFFLLSFFFGLSLFSLLISILRVIFQFMYSEGLTPGLRFLRGWETFLEGKAPAAFVERDRWAVSC